jgi:membrane-associated phospholipid phosphatase
VHYFSFYLPPFHLLDLRLPSNLVYMRFQNDFFNYSEENRNLYKSKIFSFLIIFLAFTPAIPFAQNLDVEILKGINPMNPNSEYWIQTSSSVYWVPAVLAIGSLGYGYLGGNKQSLNNGYELLISIGISQLISEALKVTVNRERPADRYPYEIFVSSPTHGGSFPSGHASAAFAIATTMALDYKKWYIVVPAYLWAGSVTYSRMYLGKHYPSDVLAGIIIGIGSGYLSHWLTKKIFKIKKSSYVQP